MTSSVAELILFICSISILFDGSLEIRNATKNDEGFYSCFAENDRGKANSSGYLTITGQHVSTSVSERQHEVGLWGCFSSYVQIEQRALVNLLSPPYSNDSEGEAQLFS